MTDPPPPRDGRALASRTRVRLLPKSTAMGEKLISPRCDAHKFIFASKRLAICVYDISIAKRVRGIADVSLLMS